MNDVTPTMLPIGTRVRFKNTIIEPATGSHPDFLMCESGTFGKITGHRPNDKRWQYSVLWDHWQSASFAIAADEIEPMPPIPIDKPAPRDSTTAEHAEIAPNHG